MTFQINPLSVKMGVEVIGLDLTRPLDAETIGKAYQAFVDSVVIVFRGQKLDADQFVAAAKNFGSPLEQHLTYNQVPGCPFVNIVSNQEKTKDGKPNLLGQEWHTDHSFWPTPPKATLLHAITLPDKGGDTFFANMRAAYDALPDDLRARVTGLKAEHAFKNRRQLPKASERVREVKEANEGEDEYVIHPVVRTHPDTGRQAIYINPLRINRYVGLAPEASVRLNDELLAHATKDEFVYRHQWQQGDLIMWDNRQAMHMVDVHYDITQPRLMHRIILEGDQPV